MKLKDFVNLKINKRNNQQSLDIRRLKLKDSKLSIDELLDMPIIKKLDKFDRI